MRKRIGFMLHHCVAHPLLVFWPRLGRCLHGMTAGSASPDDGA